VGGSGGGKPDLAQAGGADPSGLEAALAQIRALATEALR
jgi:alanyl-tRNA synthetase